MSLPYDKGTTLAGILIMGLLMIFVVPYLSYYIVLTSSFLLDYASRACISSGSCSPTTTVVRTSMGDVNISIPVFYNTVLQTTVSYVAPLLFAVLGVFSRPELLAVVFAIDLLSYAFETE